MPKGLAIASNFYNRQQAVRDWLNLAAEARRHDQFELVQKYQPPIDAGWRTIDKRIVKLRAALQEKGIEVLEEG